MIIEEKNVGPKIDYTVTGTKITFRDDLTLDLAKYERDFPVKLDICENRDGILYMGLSDYYVAQLAIPGRGYDYIADGVDEEGNPKEVPMPVPFDMSKVTLVLWTVDGGVAND